MLLTFYDTWHDKNMSYTYSLSVIIVSIKLFYKVSFLVFTLDPLNISTIFPSHL